MVRLHLKGCGQPSRILSYINVNNYISLKRGVYRPDSTYKTAKMIYQNLHTKLKWIAVVSKGKKTRWPINQRLIDASNVMV